MNNRGGPRARGHAVLAAQARRALGIAAPVHALGEVPLPLVHGALGLAACAVAFLVRVPAFGFRNGVLASAGVALGTAVVLTLYDRFVYPADARPGVDTLALPMATVGSFAIVLAATTTLWARGISALLAAAIIGGIPYLGERELAGHRDPRLRLARDLGGVTAAIPYALAGVSVDMATWSRALVAAVGLALVAFDGLRIDALDRRTAWAAAAACGAAAALAAVLGTSGGPGVRAGLLLVIWYGVRGAAASLAAGRRGVVLILEYLGFAVVALLALAWVGAGK